MEFKPIAAGRKKRESLVKRRDLKREDSEPGIGARLLFQMAGIAHFMEIAQGMDDAEKLRSTARPQSDLLHQNIDPKKRLNPKTAFEPR